MNCLVKNGEIGFGTVTKGGRAEVRIDRRQSRRDRGGRSGGEGPKGSTGREGTRGEFGQECSVQW